MALRRDAESGCRRGSNSFERLVALYKLALVVGDQSNLPEDRYAVLARGTRRGRRAVESEMRVSLPLDVLDLRAGAVSRVAPQY